MGLSYCISVDYSGGELAENVRKRVIRCSWLREPPDDEADSAKSLPPQGDSCQMQLQNEPKTLCVLLSTEKIFNFD